MKFYELCEVIRESFSSSSLLEFPIHECEFFLNFYEFRFLDFLPLYISC